MKRSPTSLSNRETQIKISKKKKKYYPISPGRAKKNQSIHRTKQTVTTSNVCADVEKLDLSPIPGAIQVVYHPGEQFDSFFY